MNTYDEIWKEEINKLEQQKSSLQKDIEEFNVNPISVIRKPVNEFINDQILLRRQHKEVEDSLQAMAHIQIEDKKAKWGLMFAEMFVSVFFIYFVVYRTMGHRFMTSVLPKIGNIDPIMIMVVIEAIMVVALTILGEYLVKREFQPSKRKAIGLVFVLSLFGFLLAIMGPSLLV